MQLELTGDVQIRVKTIIESLQVTKIHVLTFRLGYRIDPDPLGEIAELPRPRISTNEGTDLFVERQQERKEEEEGKVRGGRKRRVTNNECYGSSTVSIHK